MIKVSAEVVEAVDEMGSLDAKMAPYVIKRASAREVVVVFAGKKDVAIDGKKYRATVTHSFPQRYDGDKIKSYLTARQLKACQLPLERVITVRVVSLKSASVKKK